MTVSYCQCQMLGGTGPGTGGPGSGPGTGGPGSGPGTGGPGGIGPGPGTVPVGSIKGLSSSTGLIAVSIPVPVASAAIG